MRRQRCRSWGTLLTATEQHTPPPETETEYARYLQHKISLCQQRHLLPLQEDVTDWLNATLGTSHITVNNYLSVLDNGVLLCKLAQLIAHRARLSHSLTDGTALFEFRCWQRAPSGSFFARDNVFNFLQFCRRLGCREHALFETDGLVLHQQPRAVLLCLLELGRRVAGWLEPPALVRLELEIDEQQRLAAASARDGSDSGYSDTAHERERSQERELAGPARPTSLIPVRQRRTLTGRRPVSASVPGSALTSPAHHRSAPRLSVVDLSSPSSAAVAASRIPRLQSGRAHLVRVKMALQATPTGPTGAPISTAERARQLRERLQRLEVTPRQRSPAPAPTDTSRDQNDCNVTLLDEKVQQAVQQSAAGCRCPPHARLRRLAEGQYNVAGRTVFIRLLKGRHVMVRVGGGWDTLEHFLSRHDPCQSATLPNSLAAAEGVTTEMMLRLPASPRPRTADCSHC